MAINFKSLTYIYDEGMPYAHKALDDINLSLIEGKITAIIGQTGSGKSTLVEHLNALLITLWLLVILLLCMMLIIFYFFKFFL